MMQTRRDTITIIVGAVALVVVLALLAATHYRAFLGTAPRASDEAPQQAALNIPTIEQMCAAAGSTQGDALKQCQEDESAAQEYVIAWMGLNGFLAGGEIALDQIQLLADLGGSSSAVDSVLGLDPSSGADPSLGLDPSLGGDPTALGDPFTGGTALGGVTDPLTGDTTPVFQSPGQLAIFCLSNSEDWIKMHDCIAANDPSSSLGGAP